MPLILENNIEEQTNSGQPEKKNFYIKLISMFVPQSKEGYTNGSYFSTLKPPNLNCGESHPSNQGCFGLILHFQCKMRESAEQIVGERRSQEKSSKGPSGRKQSGMFVEWRAF